MAARFQLARPKRAPSFSSTSPTSPTSPYPASSTWTLEIPEDTKIALENITDPLVIVSYFGCSRSVQDALWTALEQTYQDEDANSPDNISSSTGFYNRGIWAWLSPPSPSPDPLLGKTIQTLHIIYRDQELNRDSEEEDEDKQDLHYDAPFNYPDMVLGPLMTLCSTRLNVISANLQDTEEDLARFTRSLKAFATQRQPRRTLDLAPLTWHWCETNNDNKRLSSINADSGIEVLREVIMDHRNSAQADKDDPKNYSAHLTELSRYFRDIDCGPSAGSIDTLGEAINSNVTLEEGSENVEDMASSDHVAWLRNLVSPSNQRSNDDDLSIDSSKVASGAELYAKLKTCLSQLNNNPQSFNIIRMRQAVRDLIHERALYHGNKAYHDVMNGHLDRQAIPLPWHTLSMIHHDAQAKALEEIEKRYAHISGYQFPAIVSEFRARCLETRIDSVRKESNAKETDDTDSLSSYEMLVPVGGLFFEFYDANARALQTHHLDLLGDNWQLFVKSRLPGSSTRPAGSTDLKDHAEFLLAVDQVRRSYLGSCIPSPEAVSVLEGLERLQQTESDSFLKTIAATNSSSTSSQLKRSGSISHQPSSFSNGDTGANDNSGNSEVIADRGSDVLTDPLTNKRTSIQAITRANSKSGSKSNSNNITNADGSGSGSGNNNDGERDDGGQTSRQTEQAPKELEQQIAEILQTKRRPRSSSQHFASKGSGSGNRTSMPPKTPTGSAPDLFKTGENKSIVQFGWTLHMLHANTLQYAWIWNWFYDHEGSSNQNVVACDSKMYTASKWIVLPAKDLVRTRKDWKISYGDRVWIVSYWFATRNAKMELPEYLPRAQGTPCRHVVPYGETYVICKTCPADVLCMRCFRASDHADHVMYLQCSWGLSVCVCSDPVKLKDNNGLHCSLHSAESHRSYSKFAKGRPCQIKFRAGERVYRCKSCATDQNQGAVICDRCFRSHNHFGHDVVVQIASEGMTCSCHDSKSWKPELRCTYHSDDTFDNTYLPKPLVILPPIPPTQTVCDPLLSSSLSLSLENNNIGDTPNAPEPQEEEADDGSVTPRATSLAESKPNRCGHFFQPGEDVYHCRDCSFNDKVVLCSRCFHGSGCINHRWKMGAFQNPKAPIEAGSEASIKGSKSRSGSVSSVVVEDLAVTEGGSVNGQSKETTAEIYKVSCDCGDPTMFKTAFDCNYHLPQEFRPVPHLSHCNYLFTKGETMYRCGTCHFVSDDKDEQQGQEGEEAGNVGTVGVESDIWLCRRCFDPADHRGHKLEAVVNERNEGFFCHCGDPTILRKNSEAGGTVAGCSASSTTCMDDCCFSCEDDHNRQTVLCTTEIKEGMLYYSCKTCQIDLTRVFCEPCFNLDAHEGHAYQKLPATEGFATLRCGCGENSAFRFATHCQQHERAGGNNVVVRCHYRASAGEWIAFCSDCYPPQKGMAPAYLCQRCRQGSDHIDHNARWVKVETDMPYPCACGSHSLSSLCLSSPVPTTMSLPSSMGPDESTINPPALCQYHTMVYKTTPSTTLYLHSHNHRSLNHPDHNEVSGYLYHNEDNDWIISRPDNNITEYMKSLQSPYLQWKDVFWLQHDKTGRYFNSMASLKIPQGFQEVTALESPHSNNDWIVEETTWLRQQILSDE